MKSLRLVVEAAPGEMMPQVAKDMVELAGKLGVGLMCEANGCMILADPDSTLAIFHNCGTRLPDRDRRAKSPEEPEAKP